MLYTVSMPEELRQQANQIWIQISGIKSPKIRQDLEKMHRNLEILLSELSQESVNCRRLHRDTPKYQELYIQIKDRMTQIEQYITLGLLSIDQ